MQEKTNSHDGINVFIEFQIIKDSNPLELTKELDILIATGKKIYVWSKTASREQMRQYCLQLKIPIPEHEFKLHKQIWDLRHKERKTFTDISNLLSVPLARVSYYSRTEPVVNLTLDDWIISYEKKDSALYPKVDFLIDNDQKLVNRFIEAGRTANLITKV